MRAETAPDQSAGGDAGSAAAAAADAKAAAAADAKAAAKATAKAAAAADAKAAAKADAKAADAKANTKAEITRAVVFLGVTLAVVLSAFALTAFLAAARGQWKSALWFINGERAFTARALGLSVASGAVFGLISNALLHFGMDSLGPFLPGGELTRAGWGNTFSGGVGAFLAALAAKAIQLSSGFQGGPLYGDALGVVAGCVAGIYVPRAITGRQ
jgi:hypothetical protein